MKAEYSVEVRAQIGNCVEVDVIVSGTYFHSPATREDPAETDFGIKSIELSARYGANDLLDLASQLLQADIEQKMPWVHEKESSEIGQIIRENLGVQFNGSSDDAEKLIEEYIKHRLDDEALDETLSELANNNELFD